MVREVNERMTYVEAKNAYPRQYILMRLDENSQIGVVLFVGEDRDIVDERFDSLSNDENCIVLEGVGHNHIGGLQ